MKTACVALGAFAALASAQGPSQAPPPALTCKINLPSYIGKATWDFTGVASLSGFSVSDTRGNADSVYDYYLRICNNYVEYPQPQCATTCGSDGNCQTGPAPAFQVCNTPGVCGTSCQRLGNSAYTGVWTPNFHNPSHGISLTYTGGDNCSFTSITGTISRARQVSIEFYCYDTSGFLPSQDLVFENTQCQYNIVMFSRLGCPMQCPFGEDNNRLCSAQGICDWDSTNLAARCFCNGGFAGKDCSTLGNAPNFPQTSYAGNIAGGFFGGLFAGIAIVAIYVFYVSYTTHQPFFDALKGLFGGGAGGHYAAHSATSAAAGDYAVAPEHAGATFSGEADSGYVAPAEHGESHITA